MSHAEQIVKDLESGLAAIVQKLKADLGTIRGNRPSAEMVQDIKVNVYDQALTVRELGALSVLPPRTIQVAVWDKSAVNAVAKAIESAHLGLTVTNDGVNVRATLSPLGDDRREEMTKLVKKTSEAKRIEIRGKRDEAMKRLKDAEGKKTITEDESFKAKEKIQKAVDRANKDVEAAMENKLKELGE